MKTVRWTVFIGGTLAGGSPNKKPCDEVARSRAKRGSTPLSLQGEGVGGEGSPERGMGKTLQGLSPIRFAERSEAKQQQAVKQSFVPHIKINQAGSPTPQPHSISQIPPHSSSALCPPTSAIYRKSHVHVIIV